MTTRTALEIAIELDAASCSSFVKLEAAEALRKQHAEIARLTGQVAKLRNALVGIAYEDRPEQLAELLGATKKNGAWEPVYAALLEIRP